MLKSIVNGAEHDIVRIPMRSKQLWNEVVSLIDTNLGKRYGFIIDVPGTYTVKVYGDILSTDFVYGNVYSNGTYSSNYYLVVNGRISAYTFTIADGEHATIYDANADSESTALGKFARWDIMANEGSTALPYVPYGMVEGWEVRDNQNRLIWGREDELQTTTGNLLFKGYDLPVKVNSLLGSAAQNGIPSPDSPIVPEFCGVRTENLYFKKIEGANISDSGVITALSGFDLYIAKVEQGIQYTGNGYVYAFFEDEPVIGSISFDSSRVVDSFRDIASPINGFVAVRNPDTIQNAMCNTGQSLLPFEPYGYKISFDNNGENLFDIPEKSATMQFLVTLVDLGEDVHFNTFTASLLFNDVEAEYVSAALIDYLKDDGTHQYVTLGNMLEISTDESFPKNVKVSGNYYNEKTDITFRKINAYLYSSGYNKFKSGTIKFAFYDTSRKDYSPYLNKTTPIYLGEVPTIRRIKKLVLTGKENWRLVGRIESVGGQYFNLSIATQNQTEFGKTLCSHYTVANPYERLTACCTVANYSQGVDVRINNPNTDGNIDDFKAYLATQYANGTPVTIWYALTNPETGIINEPLTKIGDYADELTEISVHNLSAPLYGIGDYKDILNLSTGVLTRKVKKLVLTGEESWWYSPISPPFLNRFACDDIVLTTADYTIGYSTHYIYEYMNADNRIFHASNQRRLYICDDRYSSVSDFKSFLQQQYQNGTPVTVWYVLATPETETVTVPTGMTGEIEGYLTQISTPTPTHPSIPKWNGKEETGGTYAVTVYDLPEIPTTTGQNTLTIETEKIHGVTSPLCGIGDYKDVLNLSTGVVTRKIKKWVLTGNETIGNYEGIIYLQLPDDAFQGTAIPFSTHYIGTDISIADSPNYSIRQIMTGYWGGSVPAIRIKDSSHNSSGIFQDFITTQYTAGTPVVIWYILSTPETETITVPYGLECSVEGYLTQSGIPTPSNPITPESNGILESGGTYAVEVSLVPSNLTVKGHIKPVQ